MIKLLTAYERLPRNARGALWMLASALTFTVMTTLVKFLGADYPAALQNFYRQAASLALPRGKRLAKAGGTILF